MKRFNYLLSIFVFFASTIFLISGHNNYDNLTLIPISITLMSLATLIIQLSNFKRYLAHFYFILTYFLFLVVGPLLLSFEDKIFYLGINRILNATVLTVYWAVICVIWLYGVLRIDKLFFIAKEKFPSYNNSDYLAKIKKVSKFSFYIAISFSILLIVEKILFRQEFSLQQYYLQFESNMPILFERMSNLYLFTFYIFLGSDPTPKEQKIPIVIFVLTSIFTLFYGVRNVFILNMITLIVFTSIQSYKSKKVWFKRKSIFMIFFSLPIMMSLLQIFDSFRRNIALSNSFDIRFDVLNNVKDFLTTQSNSSSVLSFSLLHVDILSGQPVPYTFGILYTYLRHNLIVRTITNSSAYVVNSIQGAFESGNLGARLAYELFPTTFLGGTGMGGNFVAELHVDYGMIGIIIGTLFLCILMTKVSQNMFSKSPFRFAFAFLIFRGLLILPRDTFFSWILNSFSVLNISYFLFIYFYAKVKLK